MSMLFTHIGVCGRTLKTWVRINNRKWICFAGKHLSIRSHTSFKITKYSKQYVLWVISVKCSRKSGHCLLTRMSLKFWSFVFAVFWAMLMRNEEETAKMTLMHYISTEAVQRICMSKFKLLNCVYIYDNLPSAATLKSHLIFGVIIYHLYFEEKQNEYKNHINITKTIVWCDQNIEINKQKIRAKQTTQTNKTKQAFWFSN